MSKFMKPISATTEGGKVTFVVYSNPPIEGNHNGMKSGAAPVLPTHSVTRSVAILSKNAERK